MFINPMWDNEVERIGKQKCTPLGYTLHVISDMLGFLGLVTILIIIGVMAWKTIFDTFHYAIFWLFAVPVCMGVLSEVLFKLFWSLALSRGWQYDRENLEASWMEAGERRTFTL